MEYTLKYKARVYLQGDKMYLNKCTTMVYYIQSACIISVNRSYTHMLFLSI